MKTILSVVSVMVITLALISLNLVSCGGGGGGGGVDNDQPPPPGGSGTGSNGVPVFWYSYDVNIAFGSGNAVQETSDHGFIVAGSQTDLSPSASQDVFLMKTNAQGTIQWKKRFPRTGGVDTFAVRETGDGGFIVTGHSLATNVDHRVYVLKTDAAGNAAAGWPKTYGAVNSSSYAVLEVSNGYMIAGNTVVFSPSQQQSLAVSALRTNATGSVVWDWSYDSFCPGGNEIGRALTATADGNYVIAGYTGCYGWKGFLIKIDGDGKELWRKVYGTSTATMERIYSVATSTDGFVLAGSHAVVSGQTPTIPGVGGPPDALVIKTDQNGNEIWRRTYGGADRDEAFSVARDQNGDYLVFGYTQSYGGTVNPAAAWQYQDLLLIKLDGSGNTVWQKVKGNRPTGSDFGVTGCAVSDGGFAMTGSSGGNVLLAKFDGNGDTIKLGATDLTLSVPGTTGIIKFENAIETAAAAVSGLTKPRQLGSVALDLLIARLNGVPVTDFCSTGTYTFNPLPTAPLTPGVSFALTFTSCVMGPVGDQATISGGLTLGVGAVSGVLQSPSYTAQTTLTSISITIVDTVGTITLNGGMRFQRAAAGGVFSELAQSIVAPAPQAFTWSESSAAINRTHVIGPFTVSDTVSSTSESIGVATDSLTVDAGFGPLTVTVTQPVVGSGPYSVPTSGSFKIAAPDSSQLTATITNGVVALAIDTNADGIVDGTISTTWDVLY